MPTEVELSQALDSVRRVVNLRGAGVGSLLAPRIRGVDSVPTVVGLVARGVTQTFGSTILTLVWEEPAGDILGYRVWATNILKRNAAPSLLGEFEHSPAQVVAIGDVNTNVIISVQTVLNNGLANRLANCPTVTAPVTLATTVIPDGSVTLPKLAVGAVDVSKYAAGQRPLQIAAALPTLPDTAYPTSAVLLNLADGKIYRTLNGTTWTKVVDGADILANSITSGAINAASIRAAILTAGVVDTSMLNVYNALVVGLTLTDNSPAAGRVAWSACTVYNQGTAYSIAAGSTASSAEKQIYWTSGASTFTAAATYTPAPNIFPIATNTDGVGDTAWNKGGGARSSVQRSNVSFALLEGFSIQPSASLTLTDPVLPFAGSGGSSLTANVLTINQAAALVGMRISIPTPYTIDSSGSTSGNTDIYVKLTVDGATAQSLKVLDTYPAATGPVTAQALNDDILTFGRLVSGTGAGAGDSVTIEFGLSCTTSLIIDVYIVTDSAAGSALARTLTGTVKFSAGYALKV